MQLLGRQVGHERGHERQGGVDRRCRSTALRTSPTSHATTTPTSDPADARPGRSRRPPAPALTSRTASATMAVRSATRAVASLTSDSPSRIVTTRRGRPIRRAMAVAATASGGATTAPRANAAGERHRQQPPGHQAHAERGEDHQPDREQPDRPAVRLEVHQRAADRGGVQQRRQQPDQHDLGGAGAPRGRTAGTTPPPRPASAAAAPTG